MNEYRCIHCGAVIDADLGAESPSGEYHEGTHDDPRPPGDWNNVCDVCNYQQGKTGTPPPMERDEP